MAFELSFIALLYQALLLENMVSLGSFHSYPMPLQVDKAEQDKQSAIIKAQGEATSARLIGEAIQENPAFITLRKIEAARDIAGTISGAANKVFLSSDSLLLNLVSLNQSAW